VPSTQDLEVKMMERIMIYLINIFCPPISVMLVAGLGMDCILNTLFFLAGVLPGHLHGFYITCTYFHRQRKVRKGRYPGGRKAGIYSEKVWNGGASNAKVRDLWEAQKRREEVEAMERGLGKRGSGTRSFRGESAGAGNGGMERGGMGRVVSANGRQMREMEGWRI